MPPRSRPRPSALARRGAAAAAATTALVAVLLSGCAGAPEPSPTPTAAAPSVEPIFASDEEALAAAIEAYEAFESASQSIASQAGEGAERIADFATPSLVPQLLDEFAQYRELGIRAEGAAVLDSFSLAQASDDGSETRVTVYVCRDVTSVRILDDSGADVTPPDRDNRTPLTASLVALAGTTKLLVDEVSLWPGDDFC
ncbi:hypothetical protein [Agromyces sp. Marseille-P2726]|uniref:hypothetical protein n=1 Tax=Agromyces sp. Marseille-P2726 TaxID=2709132 RepID=UPI00156EF03F|nr:hypothetical protein [Agromyces sp. Marseille-P2726]